MTLKNDAEFEEKSTCQLKIDMRNVTNFDTRTQKFQNFSLQGPYIEYVGGGVGRFFVGFMKYFRHTLMGHEILLKIFDGPQNFLMFYFRNFIF